MATLPRYEGTASINVPNLPRESEESLQRHEQAQGNMVRAIENAEDTFVKIKNVQQLNAANTYATEQLGALKDMSDTEQDLDSFQKYTDRIDKIGEEAAKNISGTIAKDDFIARFKIAATSTRSAILDNFRKKQIDAAQADFLSDMKAKENAYFTATYPHEKIAMAQLMKQSIADNVHAGIISATDGEKMWEKTAHDLPIGEAERDIGVNPTTALQRLQINEYGIQDEAKRAELIADAQRSILRLEKMHKQGLDMAREQMAVDLTGKLWEGTLTISQIQDELRSGTIDRKDAEHLHNALTSDRTSDLKSIDKQQEEATANKHAETFMSMYDMILKKGKAVDKRREILKEFAAGNLSRQDAEKLYTGHLIPAAGGGKVSIAEEAAAEEAGAKRNKIIAGAIALFRRLHNVIQPIDTEGDEE